MFKISRKAWIISGVILVLIVSGGVVLLLLWLFGAAQDQQWGIPIREERAVAGVTHIDFAGAGEIIVVQGDQEKLEIEGPLHAIARVQSRVRDKVLEIDYQSLEWWNPLNWFRRTQPHLRYILHLKDLEALTVDGSSQVMIEGLETKGLSIDIKGSSTISIAELKAEVLRVEIAGAAQVQLVGKVQKHNVIVTGTATYQAAQLESEEVYFQISGVSNAEVQAKKLLDVSILGSGTVTYTGNPEHVKQRISGTGSLIKR